MLPDPIPAEAIHNTAEALERGRGRGYRDVVRAWLVRDVRTWDGFERAIACMVVVTLVQTAWVMLDPGTDHTTLVGDNLLGFAGPLTGAVFALAAVRAGVRAHDVAAERAAASRSLAAALAMGLGILCFAAGQAIWASYVFWSGEETPFPSWADAAYLSAYPLLFAAVLLLPGQAQAATERARNMLDAGMVVLVGVAFSWYFLVVPTLEEEGWGAWTDYLALAYPAADLFLIYCVLILVQRSLQAVPLLAVLLLGAGFVTVIVADTSFQYQVMHGGYIAGQITDVAWSLGYMLIGLSTIVALRPVTAGKAATFRTDTVGSGDGRSLPWTELFPYVVLQPLLLLFIFSWLMGVEETAELGVDAIVAVFIAVAAVRQVLTVLENRRLQRLASKFTRELRRTNVQLELLATTDPLTGVANHRVLISSVDREVERAGRFGHPFSLLFVDLDHFKSVNDRCGHAAGDTVLCDLARIVGAATRSTDVFGRWGGEEFVLVMPETETGDALCAGERLRRTVAEHVFPGTDGLHLSCSVGVATFPNDATDRDRLIAVADAAMYTAKRCGRNQVRGAADIASPGGDCRPDEGGETLR